MREYRIADIIGTARERFSDYGELAALESWERSQLIRLGVNELTAGIVVIPAESALRLVGNTELTNEAGVSISDLVPSLPPVVPLTAPSFTRR